METLTEIIKQNGFDNETEFHKMIASIDLSTQDKIKKFKDWQCNDGTKNGLLKLTKE